MPSALDNFLADMARNLRDDARGSIPEPHHALTALPRPCAVSCPGARLEAGAGVSVVELTIPHASEIDRA